MVAAALSVNAGGIVLFSSDQSRRIHQNASALSLAGDEMTARFLALAGAEREKLSLAT